MGRARAQGKVWKMEVVVGAGEDRGVDERWGRDEGAAGGGDGLAEVREERARRHGAGGTRRGAADLAVRLWRSVAATCSTLALADVALLLLSAQCGLLLPVRGTTAVTCGRPANCASCTGAPANGTRTLGARRGAAAQPCALRLAARSTHTIAKHVATTSHVSYLWRPAHSNLNLKRRDALALCVSLRMRPFARRSAPSA